MLEIKNAFKTFNPGTPNEVKSLSDISFTIQDGSFVVILGTNGSGKTTLLNAVSGSIILDSGEIFLNDVNITKWNENKRATMIGRVFQNPFSGTSPNLSIAENLALAGLRGRNRSLKLLMSSKIKKQLIDKVKILEMDLEGRLDNPIGLLSGGQRQALTLLMATWIKPKLLLLDEHTAALDPKTGKKVIGLTEKIIRENNLTSLMVTHSMQQAVSFGDRIIMLHKGQIAFDFAGSEKQRLRVADLLSLFDELRRKDQVDFTAAEMLERNYI